MNKQFKIVDGKREHRGIEWTDYTWNPVGGCFHACRWKMPDGKIAVCYAETTAESIASKQYPEGFEHHYWRPNKLNEPATVREPSKIFIDSMSDLFGAWVIADEINAVLKVATDNPQHQFQSLTKNPKRLLSFKYPLNFWPGVSTPPDFFKGKELSQTQKEKMLNVTMGVLWTIRGQELGKPRLKTWLSVEPLSWDVAPIIERWPDALSWVVIGAASNGHEYYQPNRECVINLLDLCDKWDIPVFFKGNLIWSPHREEFPNVQV